MDLILIVVFLVVAGLLFRRHMRGVRWDAKAWLSLAGAALGAVLLLLPCLHPKPLPMTPILPLPVAKAAMLILFTLLLTPPFWQALDEVERLADKSQQDTDRQQHPHPEETSRSGRPDGQM